MNLVHKMVPFNRPDTKPNENIIADVIIYLLFSLAFTFLVLTLLVIFMLCTRIKEVISIIKERFKRNQIILAFPEIIRPRDITQRSSTNWRENLRSAIVPASIALAVPGNADLENHYDWMARLEENGCGGSDSEGGGAEKEEDDFNVNGWVQVKNGGSDCDDGGPDGDSGSSCEEEYGNAFYDHYRVVLD